MIASMFEKHINYHNAKRMIIICLKSKIEEWQKDCTELFPNKKIIIANKKIANDITLKKFDILIINFEMTWRMPSELLMATDNYTFIAIDESHKAKEPTSKQTKFIINLGDQTVLKTIATATPMEQGYHNLYAQFRFLGLLGGSYTEFKNRFCIEVSQFTGSSYYKKISGYKNIEELDYIIAKYCRYYERQIKDNLEPRVFEIEVPIDKNYTKIAKDRVYKEIVLSHVSQKRHALKALCSGVIVGRDLEENYYEYNMNNYKLEWVIDFIKSNNNRIIIFYQYNIERDCLYNAIKELNRNVARYCGKFKEHEIFIKNNDCVILCQFKSGSTGIDWLKLSNIMIFYTLPDSYTEFYQTKGRIDRIGQINRPNYIILLSKHNMAVDRLCYESLKNKQDFTDLVFQKNFKDW